jgi:hypothetical protein
MSGDDVPGHVFRRNEIGKRSDQLLAIHTDPHCRELRSEFGV